MVNDAGNAADNAASNAETADRDEVTMYIPYKPERVSTPSEIKH
jgi:hypothetical protein